MQKKGQVTYFVLAGLVILLGVVSYYTYQSLRVKTTLDLLVAERAKLPKQVQPVAQMWDACAERVTRNALNQVGAQGGLLDIPDDPLPTSSFAPVAAVLEIVPNSDMRVPLWFRERGNGIPEVNVPSRADVERNLALVIAEQFPTCFADLTSLSEQGFAFEGAGSAPRVTVTMDDQAVHTLIDYPLQVRLHDATFTITSAMANVQTRFGALFQMAQDIFNAELTKTFLENKTLDMLIAYDPEIPFSGTSFSCNEKVWSKAQVTNRLKTILFENVAAMRVQGTNYVEDQKLQYLTFDVLPQAQRDVSVSLLYAPSWPTLVDITPSQGDILRGDLISQKSDNLVSRVLSSFFCLSNHHFVYNIKYPVLFTLRDAQGFVFQFATEVIIDRNVPRKNLHAVQVLPDTSSRACLFKEAELRVRTLSVAADNTLVPLDNVDLTFKCASSVCPVGAVQLGASSAAVRVPRCVNGIVEGTKQDYLVGKTIVSTNQGAQDVDVVLEQIYVKPVEFFVIDKATGQVRKPYSSETLTFQFDKVNQPLLNAYLAYQDAGGSCADDDACGPDLACVGKRCQFQACTRDDACASGSCVLGKCAPKKSVQLAVGQYHVRSFISRSGSTPFVTQKKVIEKCIDIPAAGLAGFFRTDEKCFTSEVPSVELPSVIVGGATFDHVFTRDDLTSSAPLRLYALAEAPPASIEDLSRIQIALATNQDHPFFRAPEV